MDAFDFISINFSFIVLITSFLVSFLVCKLKQISAKHMKIIPNGVYGLSKLKLKGLKEIFGLDV